MFKRSETLRVSMKSLSLAAGGRSERTRAYLGGSLDSPAGSAMECGSGRVRERRMAVTSVRRASGSEETAETSSAGYLARVQEIAPTLAAAAAEIDRRRELPEAIVEALIERGLFRLLLPRSPGGAGGERGG